MGGILLGCSSMKRKFAIAVLIAAAVSSAMGQAAGVKFTVFDSKGNPATLEAVVAAAGTADAVFIGEFHDDAVGHAFQLAVFEGVVNRYSAGRPVALSLEMFERDVQVVLDEYLAGQITEDHFLRSSRPWGNYKTDYRPLVELARQKRLSVIAANAPRRYVNIVSRLGPASVENLSGNAKKWLAPLPVAVSSTAYANKFKAAMEGAPSPANAPHGAALASQTLWDATMADSAARWLRKNKRGLIVHLNGGFHTESRLGLIEHFLRYQPRARAIVVTIRYEDDFTKFDPAKHSGIGDFVVLTDAKQPRSQR